MRKHTGYAGSDGLTSLVMGGRGRAVQIRGVLHAANSSALRVLIDNIQAYILDTDDVGPATLIDDFGEIWENVELMAMRLTTTIDIIADGTDRVEYIIRGRQLF
jgi:hypothetical protein